MFAHIANSEHSVSEAELHVSVLLDDHLIHQRWLKIRTNNMLERLNREIRRRTRVVGTFPDGESALMLVCARLRHVTGTQWGVKRYMSMKSLEQMDREKHGADCCDLA